MPLLPGIFASSGGANTTVSGGIIYSDSTYYYSVFLGGTTTFTVGVAPLNVDLIVIGGGGGGGTAAGGGGGAGGVVVRSGMLTTGSYTAVIGLGGQGATGDGGSGSNGGNSTFDTITAFGGGGGNHNATGATGGSGGGAGYTNSYSGGAATQTSNGGGTGYGYPGGGNSRAGSGPPYPCGGGGGAGGAGGTAVGSSAGVGGTGITNALINSIAAATGLGQLSSGNYYLAGGGGGSVDVTRTSGGLGGGGYGGTVVTASANTATDGLDNYGAGGGGGDVDGGGYPPVRAGRGGDGLIVIRYSKGDVVAPTNSYTTSGLLFNYDASNTSSYPGSGTTWTDLSNARNIALTNTSYSSSDGGGIVFNGSSSYGYASLGNLGGTYTIEIALKYTAWNDQGSDALALTASAANNHGLLIETNYSGSLNSGTNTIRYLHRMPYGGGGSDDDLNSTSTLALNTNYVITIVRIQGQRQQIYFNGVKARTTDWYPTNAAFDSGLNQLNLGRLTAVSNSRLFSGTIYSLRGYTRALPPEEIKANFNAIKTKLGL